jgi:hypothetical protein
MLTGECEQSSAPRSMSRRSQGYVLLQSPSDLSQLFSMSSAPHSAVLACRYDAIVALDEDVRRRIVEMGVEENPQESNW